MQQANLEKMLLAIVTDRSPREWVVVDPAHRIVFANASLLRALRKRREEVIGRTLPDAPILAPVLATMDGGEELKEQEISVYSQVDRAHTWYLANTYLFGDEAGRPQYAAGNFLVIDKFKAIENRLDAINLKIIKSFIRAIGARDTFTISHAENVAALMVGLADYMRFAAEETALAYLVGLVHDIGKIGIPEAILTKPGRLTAEECEIVKRHPTIGADIVGEIDGFATIAAIVRHHHERWDGGGYPGKLDRDGIPVLSRMLAVCDAYDAMIQLRCYRTPCSARQTLAEIERCAGGQFDPIIAKCFTDYVRHQKTAPLTLEPLNGSA